MLLTMKIALVCGMEMCMEKISSPRSGRLRGASFRLFSWNKILVFGLRMIFHIMCFTIERLCLFRVLKGGRSKNRYLAAKLGSRQCCPGLKKKEIGRKEEDTYIAVLQFPAPRLVLPLLLCSIPREGSAGGLVRD